MNVKTKLKYCSIIYTCLIIFITTIIIYFQTYSIYFRFGIPDKEETDLLVLSVKIDNYYKYCSLLGLIAIIRTIKVLVTEIADPILSFSIYNPDKKNIKEISKCELQFYGNYLYLLDSLRYVLTLIITITQIDLALFGILIDQLTTVFTIRLLLNEKTFDNNYETILEEMV